MNEPTPRDSLKKGGIMKKLKVFFVVLPVMIICLFLCSCSGKDKEANNVDTTVDQALKASNRLKTDSVESPTDSRDNVSEENWHNTFAFVKNEIRFEPCPSVLKSHQGVMWSRKGNAREQALVLAELLRNEGEHVRFVFGRLDDDRAAQLIGSIFPDKEKYSYDEDVPIANPLQDKELIEAVRNHCWVQINKDNDWINLDPCFCDAEIGKAYAPVEELTESFDKEQLSRMTIAMYVEKGKFTETGIIDPEMQTVLEWQGTIREVSNLPVAVKIIANIRSIQEDKEEEKEESPTGGILGGLAGKPKKSKAKKVKKAEITYHAQLMVGGDEKGNGQFSQMIHTSPEKQKDEEVITRVLLCFKIESSGEDPVEIERILFEKHQTAEKPHYFQRHSIFITGNEIPRETWEKNLKKFLDIKKLEDLKDNLDGIKSKLENKKDLKTLYTNSISLEDEIGPQAGHFINLIFASTSDEITEDLGQSLSVFSYYAKPRIIINSFMGTGDDVQVSIDLRQDSKEAIVYPGQAIGIKLSFLYGRGVMESILEGKVLELLTQTHPLTTASLMQKATENNISIKMFSALEVEAFEELQLPPMVAQKAGEVFESGRVLIIPSQAIEYNGDLRWGWWDLNPQTGEVVGVMDSGLHQAVIQRTILETTGMLHDDMGLVIGAITGCVDTHWVLFTLILKYGELNKAALQEAKNYMKTIGSYLCPEFDATDGIGVGVSVELEDCWKEEIGIGFHGGLKIDMGWCAKFAKGFKCASTSILNFYIKAAEDREK